jgi:hypothetical protein
LVVIALKGDQIIEMVDFFIAEKITSVSRSHFTIDKNKVAKTKESQFKKETIYYVGTNDYCLMVGTI